MRKEVLNLAKIIYISLNNSELALTGSINLRTYDLDLERDLLLSDADFLDTIGDNGVLDVDFHFPPFTKEIELTRDTELLTTIYQIKQYEYDGLKFDILTNDEEKVEADWFTWFEETELGKSYVPYVTVSQLVNKLIPDITSDEFTYISNFTNNFSDNSILLDRFANIGNAKLNILSKKYGDNKKYVNIEKLKQDKHFKDILKMNDLLQKNPNINVIPCKILL